MSEPHPPLVELNHREAKHEVQPQGGQAPLQRRPDMAEHRPDRSKVSHVSGVSNLATGRVMNVDAVLAEIRALSRRLDDSEDRSDERHTENVKRFDKQDEKLDRIELQCNTTNGRVSKLEQTKVWLPIVIGAVWTAIGAVWFVLTQVLGYHR
jgi:hypothetical protein